MELFQGSKCKNTEGGIFVQLLTAPVEHIIHQYHCLSSQDKKKGITDSILVHVGYIF